VFVSSDLVRVLLLRHVHGCDAWLCAWLLMRNACR
jgi:hypothetical protein